ncbi:MAG: protein kinase [Vicinamibacterales bacterium]
MRFSSGTRLGPYEIVGALGAGGMGEVYKARDTRLDRFVALKILESAAALTGTARARLLEEARSVSALNHPAIVTFHDILAHDGIDVLVMELVAGQSLAHVAAGGRIDTRRALKLASQLADALATAHAAGVIHRDLKPSNVMVTPDDRVKLLDFGLAKLMFAQPEIGATRTALTSEGTIVGTVAYMSPEQAEGRPLDARSDIFSFGAVMYEMVTGRRAFGGGSSAATLSAVLRDDPPAPSDIAKDVPVEVDRLIARCLRKDPARRFQSMGEVRAAIDDLRVESDSRPAALPARRRALATGLVLLVAIGLLAAGWLATRTRFTSPPAFKTTQLTGEGGLESHPAISPDGRQLAYIADGGRPMEFDLYVKLLAGAEALRLTRTAAAEWSPAWSPDGSRIAFYRMVDPEFGPLMNVGKAELLTMSALGGDERKVADVLLVFDRTFAPAGLSELVPLIAWLDDSHLAYISAPAPTEPGGIIVKSLGTGESWRLTRPSPAYAGDGCLHYSREHAALYFARDTAGAQATLYRLPLTAAFGPAADPQRIETGVSFALSPIPDAAGGMLFVENADQVKWLAQPGGEAQPLSLRGTEIMQLTALSAGNRLAYAAATRSANMYAWKADGAQALVPISPSSFQNYAPAYSPDGRRIAFVTTRMGPVEIWEAAQDGAGARAIVSFPGALASYPDWSPDGRRLVFFANPEGNWDLFLANPDGGGITQLTSGPEIDYVPRWSRDGRWIYFTRQPDLWRVRPDGTEARRLLARAAHAHESLDGRTLYFARYELDSADGTIAIDLWSRPVEGGDETRLVRGISNERNFAVGRRGLYFLRVTGRESSELRLYEFGSRRERLIMRLRQLPLPGLALAPDESGGLLVLSDRPQSDIILAERVR